MSFQVITIAVFSVVMGVAAFEDFRRLTIPNVLPVALGAIWVPYAAAALTPYGALTALGCAFAVLLVAAVLFARGYMGGGDVKLLGAASLWAGPAGVPALLVLTALLGGGLALFLLMPFGNQFTVAARGMLGQPTIPTERGLATRVPYGIAIAGAAIFVVLSSHIG